MDTTRPIIKALLQAIFLVVFLIGGIFTLNTLGISLGKVEFLPASTITVMGEANKQETNQIATYYVGVSASNDDKQTAINEVNTKMTDIIKKVKEFGVEDKDIQTQNVSVNEDPGLVELQVYPPVQRNLGRWHANNSITITLKDVTKAQALADMLNTTGANQISGPNYTLDTNNTAADDLLSEAIEDARIKADKIAKASGRRLGKVITVSESGSPIYQPIAFNEAKSRGGDTASTPVEPGSQTIYKSVTVVFELK